MSKRYQESELSASIGQQMSRLYGEALQQYGKAVTYFRLQLGEGLESNPSSLESAPACFVLSIMFEFMQGNAVGLSLHLRNTTKLKSIFGGSQQAQSFVHLLALIEMIAGTWLDLDCFQSDASPHLQKVDSCQEPSSQRDVFKTLYHDLVNIKNDVMTWRHAVASAHRDTKVHSVNVNTLQ